MSEWKNIYPGVESMTIAVMGCIVNGLANQNMQILVSAYLAIMRIRMHLFIDGKKFKTLSGPDIEGEFINILQGYIETKYTNTI